MGHRGIQLTASVIGENDVLKVIDQGADDTTNAVSIRQFFKRVTGVATTERTEDATLIQTATGSRRRRWWRIRS
ncbi:phnJ protein [Klebsiella pneumoniae]|uniref:PhnJ protein n=1 Tax=Klebsiella pneumoniae TaxID=573 RepID=A0A378B6M5_KLEPN|nr:phnJ protein [Klebsiella pneumoniae]